jgi:hypothetical protein
MEQQSAGSENEPGKENESRKGSIVSNASRLSSQSSTFFPNASRSPCNLTSLAARVHSPDPGRVQKQGSLQQNDYRTENDAKVVCSTTSNAPRPVLQKWQLPCLNFRPFSLSSFIQCSSDRPRTSSGITVRACTEVISPTPEHPLSLQSRKRFSKILDIDENYSEIDPRRVKRSSHSLSFLSLTKVDEIPERNYPARISVPPCSPLKAVTDNDSVDPNDKGVSSKSEATPSQTTKPQRSTVESLLDRHIEALGLIPENTDDQDDVPAHGVDAHFLSGVTDHTFNGLCASLAKQNITRSHSLATAPSNTRFSLGSPERRRLMPRRLFASLDMSTSKLPSVRSAPQSPGPSGSGDFESDSPSYGWQTLASSSQLSEMPSFDRMPVDEADKDPEQDTEGFRGFKVRRRSALSLSRTSSSGWSQSVEDLSRCIEEPKIHRRPRDVFERQASHRRRQRVRLKLKCNSVGLAFITPREMQGSRSGDHAESIALTAQADEALESNLMHGPAKLDSRLVSFPHNYDEVPVGGVHDNSTSPEIPHRWSSLINIVQQSFKRSFDVVRRPSVRTMCSHPSIYSLSEPVNSTRFAAQNTHMVSRISIPMLVPADLGLPLHASTLDLSIPFAPVSSTVRPTIRETRSFFSNESSGLQNKPGTSGGTGALHRKLGLHSLRNVIPASPRTSVIQRAFSAKAQGCRMQVHQSCNNIGGAMKSFDEHAPLDGTVGMSDFAYRKRKMVQKVKNWWMRHRRRLPAR